MITALLLLLPLMFSLLIILLKKQKWIRILAVFTTISELLVALYGLFLYVTQCRCNWILDPGWDESLHVSFRFGVDNLSLILILVTTFLLILFVIFSFGSDDTKPGKFYSRILFLEMAMIGMFTTTDGIFFFLFLQIILFILPSSILHPPSSIFRHPSSLLRLPYRTLTILSSILLLAALLFLFSRSPAPKSFEIIYLYAAHLSVSEQAWILAAFVISFGSFLLILLFNFLQKKAFAKANLFKTLLLFGIILEMIVYGILRLMLPICAEVLKKIT